MRDYNLMIEATEAELVEGKALTTRTSSIGVEFIQVESPQGLCEIRLDKVIAITVLSDGSSFGRVEFGASPCASREVNEPATTAVRGFERYHSVSEMIWRPGLTPTPLSMRFAPPPSSRLLRGLTWARLCDAQAERAGLWPDMTDGRS